MNRYRYNIKVFIITMLLSTVLLYAFFDEICIYLYIKYGFRTMVSLCWYYLILFFGSIAYVFLYREKRKWIHILLLAILPCSVFLALRYPIAMVIYGFLTFLYTYTDVTFYSEGKLTKKRIISYLTKHTLWFITWSAVVSLGVLIWNIKDYKQETYDPYEIHSEYQENTDYLDAINMLDT